MNLGRFDFIYLFIFASKAGEFIEIEKCKVGE
jgi:hypothetical protein